MSCVSQFTLPLPCVTSLIPTLVNTPNKTWCVLPVYLVCWLFHGTKLGQGQLGGVVCTWEIVALALCRARMGYPLSTLEEPNTHLPACFLERRDSKQED